MNEKIRKIIVEHVNLVIDIKELENDDNLYEAGMTSHASVNVLLALENEFDIEFPDRLLSRSVFSSISSITEALIELNVVNEEFDNDYVR